MTAGTNCMCQYTHISRCRIKKGVGDGKRGERNGSGPLDVNLNFRFDPFDLKMLLDLTRNRIERKKETESEPIWIHTVIMSCLSLIRYVIRVRSILLFFSVFLFTLLWLLLLCMLDECGGIFNEFQIPNNKTNRKAMMTTTQEKNSEI